MKKNDDVVTVVRDDGKEFLIRRHLLAQHINRGFKVKNKAEQPSEEELSKAVGYQGPKGKAKVPKSAKDEPVEDDQPTDEPKDTVPEEKPVAKVKGKRKPRTR